MTLLSYEKMICPRCGFKMNRHSEKLVRGSGSDLGPSDEYLGGFLMEFHACPNCGAVASRPAGAS